MTKTCIQLVIQRRKTLYNSKQDPRPSTLNYLLSFPLKQKEGNVNFEV